MTEGTSVYLTNEVVVTKTQPTTLQDLKRDPLSIPLPCPMKGISRNEEIEMVSHEKLAESKTILLKRDEPNLVRKFQERSHQPVVKLRRLKIDNCICSD